MFRKVPNILAIEGDAKTIKGNKIGVLTGILYLAPHELSGFQVCPKASEGCKLACLYTAGRGIYTRTQEGRINKTKWFFEDRSSFMEALIKDVGKVERKAKRMGMIPAIRLNGTSDIAWEKIRVVKDGIAYASVMEAFPKVKFYDYTKVLNRRKALELRNYHLTFSLSESNDKDATKALEQGYNLAVVLRLGRKEKKPTQWNGFPVIDGDKNDARFKDKKGGHVVVLFPKGKGRYDQSGFVRDVDSTLKVA